LKNFEAPELRGPGACAPPAPWLIRHCPQSLATCWKTCDITLVCHNSVSRTVRGSVYTQARWSG